MNIGSVIPLARFPKIVVDIDATIKAGLQSLAATGLLICCVVDERLRLLGIFTDADARRALLSGMTTTSPLRDALNARPVVGFEYMSLEELTRAASAYGVQRIPILDGERRVVGVYLESSPTVTLPLAPLSSTAKAISSPKKVLPNPYFILAGGLGTRLRPVVSECPKPLAMVGDRPILQTIIEQAYRSGFRNIYVSVNYMADMIEQHLSDQIYRDMNLHLQVFRESRRLGTAGSLNYLRDLATRSLVVSNADILTTLDFSRPLEFHDAERADITILVRRHEMTVPYGVVDLSDKTVLSVREKPLQSFTVNAGMYVMSLRALELVEPEVYLDMPELISRCLAKGLKVIAYPMTDYWLDIGRPEDFLKANQEYLSVFNP